MIYILNQKQGLGMQAHPLLIDLSSLKLGFERKIVLVRVCDLGNITCSLIDKVMFIRKGDILPGPLGIWELVWKS
jgi:hypothetical protein